VAVLGKDPRRESDLDGQAWIGLDLETSDIDKKLIIRLQAIDWTQGCVRNIVVLETLDQLRLKQLWNAVCPLKGLEIGIILGENSIFCV